MSATAHQDLVVVITGSGQGIGRVLAQRFAREGARVIVSDIDPHACTQTAAELDTVGVPADVTQAEDCARLVEKATTLFGRLDVMVCNAGGAFGASSVEDSDPEDWKRMFDVNVIGVQRVTSALLPLLRTAAADGHADIMTVTSTAGFVPYEGGGGYNAAKFAAHGVVGVLRLELAGEPIRILEIAPGMVKTDEFAFNRLGGDTAKVEALYADVKNPLVAEDVAEAIVHAIELPGHVNMDMITIRPVAQAAQHKLIRGELKPKA